MMNIFAPYHVIKQSNTELHLQLPKGWVVFKKMFFRFFPFILSIPLVALFLNGNDLPVIMLVAVTVACVVVMILIFFKSFSTELHIQKPYITITINKWNGTVQKEISIADVEKLLCKVKYGRGGGAYYSMLLHNKQRVTLMDIPLMYLDKEKTNEANKIFSSLTGLTISME